MKSYILDQFSNVLKLSIKKNIINLLLTFLLIVVIVTNCSKDNKIHEGSIEYEISYPCLEESSNSLMFFLPKKMITIFKDNAYKNKFIFKNNNSTLEATSFCETKKTTLAFGFGKNIKYTKLDSSTINLLLGELPEYQTLNKDADTVTYLGKKCFQYDITSNKIDTDFKIITTNEIMIKDMNWCTPFNRIDQVMLEYKIIQYGIEMQFKATKINNIKVDNNFLKVDSKFKFLEIKQYLKEVKSLLSMFICE